MREHAGAHYLSLTISSCIPHSDLNIGLWNFSRLQNPPENLTRALVHTHTYTHTLISFYTKLREFMAIQSQTIGLAYKSLLWGIRTG